jgi:uncharacterized membrane protein HdeD (DUF308 family)
MKADDLSQQTLRETIANVIAAHWKLFLLQGIVMCALGLAAVALPYVWTLAIDIAIGWLFCVGGVVRVVSLLQARKLAGRWWALLGAVAAIAIGVLLALRPLEGVLALTLMLIALFLVEGVSAIFAALDWRHHASNWGWLLLSGIIDLVLAALIWLGWPATAAWAIGLLTGVNLFFLGLSLVMLAIAVPSSPKTRA